MLEWTDDRTMLADPLGVIPEALDRIAQSLYAIGEEFLARGTTSQETAGRPGPGEDPAPAVRCPNCAHLMSEHEDGRCLHLMMEGGYNRDYICGCIQ